jgi:hypothetical protein
VTEEKKPEPVVIKTRVGFTQENGMGCAMLMLDDGGILTIRPLITDVFRTDQKNEYGEPVYIIGGAQLVTTLSRMPAVGDALKAEGWLNLVGDNLIWLHQPSHRVVVLDADVPCKTPTYDSTAIPCLREEPADLATRGYIVRCYTADENGNPIDGNPIDGDAFWVAGYGEALRWARRMRQSILDETPSGHDVRQLTLDDVIERQDKEA